MAGDRGGRTTPTGEAGIQLLRVGIQGEVIGPEERKDASLVLAIDVSGSMREGNRLELVKDSVRILLDELGPGDEIGIVTYDSRAQNLLEPTGVENKDAILGALRGLTPGKSTNVEEGLQFGYHMARQMNRPGRITRVILLSDGVANVGNVEAELILDRVRLYLEEGITISTVGVGMGNFNDVLLERLANDGNGNYAYIDTLAEARRIFVDNIAGTLQVIARDAKVQVEFNPEVVQRYRLLGYDNREVADEDFRNDAVDAGEVGAGHSVTALYEVLLNEGATGDLATVYVRYEDPDTGDLREVGRSFSSDDPKFATTDASPRFLLTAAVAEFAEILRGSYWSQDGSISDARELAQWAAALLPQDSDVIELLRMLEQAERITSATPSPKVVRVEARDLAGSGEYRFSPDLLNFSVGQTVEFQITGQKEFHTFTSDELRIDVAVPVGQTVSFSYTFDNPGTYRVISIPNESAGMVATIVVR